MIYDTEDIFIGAHVFCRLRVFSTGARDNGNIYAFVCSYIVIIVTVSLVLRA